MRNSTNQITKQFKTEKMLCTYVYYPIIIKL